MLWHGNRPGLGPHTRISHSGVATLAPCGAGHVTLRVGRRVDAPPSQGGVAHSHRHSWRSFDDTGSHRSLIRHLSAPRRWATPSRRPWWVKHALPPEGGHWNAQGRRDRGVWHKCAWHAGMRGAGACCEARSPRGMHEGTTTRGAAPGGPRTRLRWDTGMHCAVQHQRGSIRCKHGAPRSKGGADTSRDTMVDHVAGRGGRGSPARADAWMHAMPPACLLSSCQMAARQTLNPKPFKCPFSMNMHSNAHWAT